MTHIPEIQTEMEKAIALLSTATELMNRDRLVSISALNGMISNICLWMSEEGYARCASLKPLLIRLNEQIDSFHSVLLQKSGVFNIPLKNG